MEKSGAKWGIYMFLGEYHHSLDEKGRITIPAKYREMLGENFVITRGIEHCIYVYPLTTFEKITSKLETLPFTKSDARRFTRFFLSGASNCSFDKQGRIMIAAPLLSYSELKKDCVIVGSGDRLEIWNQEKWEEFMDVATNEMSDIAEGLFDNGNA